MSFFRDNAPFLSAGFLLTFGSAFGQTFFISLFSGEIRAAFGLSHGAWGAIYAIGTTTSAAVMIWTGALTDRLRIRQLGFLTLLLSSLACLGMALISAVWLLPLVILLLRFSGQGMMSHLAAVAMSRWFIATRGKALSVAALGFNVAEAGLPIVVVALMTIVEWQTIWLGAALLSLLMIPILSRLLRLERTPQSLAQSDVSLGMESRHWTRGEVLRHPLFSFMVPALLGPSAFNTAFFFQQVPFADAKGLSHLNFVSLIPIYTLFGIAAMILSGILLDRFGTARLIPFYQLPIAGAFLVFSAAESSFGLLCGFLLLGMTTGANSTLPNAFWAEFYGTKNLGSIKAMAAAVMVLGSAIGPALTGALLSLNVGLEMQYKWISVYFLLTCLSVWFGIRTTRQRLTATA